MKPVWGQVLDAQRRRLDRLADRRGIAPLRSLYDEANGLALKRMRLAMRSMGGDRFTVHHQRFVLAQLHQGQLLLAKRMAGELGDLTREVAREAIRGVADDITRLESVFRGATVELPLEEAATFRGIISGRATSMMSKHASSVARYTAQGVTEMEGVLGTSLLAGEAPMEALGRIEEFVDGDWWRAERVIRTEASFAFNATRRDAMEEAADELPDLMMRWTEHCSDDLTPFDNRVGVDSLAMHGQIAAPGEMFTVPDSSPAPEQSRWRKGVTEVPSHLAGQEFEAPPNRPNDRAVLLPWRKSWGIPAWRWRDGQRVVVR
jgi:hypothetical protein